MMGKSKTRKSTLSVFSLLLSLPIFKPIAATKRPFRKASIHLGALESAVSSPVGFAFLYVFSPNGLS